MENQNQTNIYEYFQEVRISVIKETTKTLLKKKGLNFTISKLATKLQ